MPMNRVQFQPGQSMPEFLSRYGTEAQCEAALQAQRWPSGFACPGCGGEARTAFRRQGRLVWQCAGCQRLCSVTSGTVFESSKLPLSRWFHAMQLLTQAMNNVSALELRRRLGVSYPSAWLMKHKLMELMRQREDKRQLTGRVEIDDACLGGQRSGGKPGRGSENKVPFVAAGQTTEAGKAHLVCLSKRPFTRQSMDEFMAKSLALPLTMVSDGLGCFTVFAASGAVHDRTVTGGGKESVKLPQFNAVDTLLGHVKTAMTGTCHAVEFAKYADRHLAEVQYRFNRRNDLRAILQRLARAAVATAPISEAKPRRAEVHC